MKKTKIFAVLILTVTILAFCINSNVYGEEIEPRNGVNQEQEAGEPVVTNDENDTESEVSKNKDVHKGDLYILGNVSEYVMDKVVDGNVFFMGNSLKVTGQINGSLFAFSSGKIEIDESASIACHTFAFADIIELNGITYDAYIAGGSFKMGENAAVNRDLRGFMNYMYMQGTVGRNVLAYSPKIEVPETANKLHIRGDLRYEAMEEIENLDKVAIIGQTKFAKMPERRAEDNVMSYVWNVAGTVVFNVAVYMFLIFLSPKFVERTKEYISTKSLLAFSIGVAFTVIVPVIILLLLFTIVGIPLSCIMLLVYGIVLVLSTITFAVMANEFISDKLKLENDKLKKILLMIPVSIVLWGLKEIPTVGSWISIAVFFVGVGTILVYQWDKRKKISENS